MTWNQAVEQQRWVDYLNNTPTYGTYEDRLPEYTLVVNELFQAGLRINDLIVDVGAGWCDLDHALRVQFGWRGRYLPFDGAIQGLNLHSWRPNVPADCYVSVETLEHLRHPLALLDCMTMLARKAVVVTTPNPLVVDVLAVDLTHVTPVWPAQLEDRGFVVTPVTLNPGRGVGDTLIGVWKP